MVTGYRVVENGETAAQFEIKDGELRASMARSVVHALAHARAEALEEAAKLADELAKGAPNLLIQTVCRDVAGCIRALASKGGKP